MSTIAQQHEQIQNYLDAFDFSGLFIDPTLGWDWPEITASTLRVPTKNGFVVLTTVAEKCGVKVLLVPPDQNGRISPSDQRKALEKAVTPLATEHLLIFTDKAKTRQIWLWTSRLPGQPVRHRELKWEKGKPNTLLLQKLSSIAFTLDEQETLDITGVVHRLRDSLDRDRVTRRFYDHFKREKDIFRNFIEGLAGNELLDWYTSLMLNRLMFCYFLQRQGFLNGEQKYLRNRLDHVRENIGENQFHSFYRSFLRRLFHEGLGQQARDKSLLKLIGNVPYLNGGIFEEHRIEREHPELNIPDEAFDRVFNFLDQYDWHLDDRPIAEGNEINPEILGYVFEKYTNQKEMGAYYTKEDITDYISKNCIIPFLLDSVGKKLGDSAWDLLRNDPDRYIYPAVLHGAGENEEEWRASLPDNIAIGLDVPSLKNQVTSARPIPTLELRKDWNNPTPSSRGLPTEIWRETIARHERCHELRRKLRDGEVRSINDLITLNLNIRQFAEDIILEAGPELLSALFKAIRKVTVLDPTCGSGAFLFAALNILEPLYRGCLDRMRALLDDWTTTGEKHPIYKKEFTGILEQVERHPNEDYWVFKSIIVHNLYGVDIMEEAVEICKLRLFLKLAAQLHPGDEIEPLPDIDFNIRSGNTLVGYATRDEVRRAFTEHQGGGAKSQLLLGGIEHSLDDYRRIEEQADMLDTQFRLFQDMQDDYGLNAADFRKAKEKLTNRLENLRDQLDRFLAGDYDKRNLNGEKAYEKWRRFHQPFHWFVEFYGILNGGGFDVIIGNPPYVETSKIKNYKLLGYKTLSCGNLYANCVERCMSILSGRFGVIVPLSGLSTARMAPYQTLLESQFSSLHLSFFSGDAHPSVLFDGVKYRLSIILGQSGSTADIFSGSYLRWSAVERPNLFPAKISYRSNEALKNPLQFAKAGNSSENEVLQKISSKKPIIGAFLRSQGPAQINYHRSPVFWIRSMDFEPYFKSAQKSRSTDHLKDLRFESTEVSRRIGAILNSTLFYFWFSTQGNCRNVTGKEIERFPCGAPDSLTLAKVEEAFTRLMEDLKKNSKNRVYVYEASGKVEYQEFYPDKSKRFIDQIDAVLAEHYGFTEEELDFIINYDIKYRMGLGGSGGNGDED